MKPLIFFLQKNPNDLVVRSGPNFPQDYPSQLNFVKKFPHDIYVPIEGEFSFLNIVRKALNVKSKKIIKLIVHSIRLSLKLFMTDYGYFIN